MKLKYVGDNFSILVLAGIRWVERVDHLYGEETFTLHVDYKGSGAVIEYGKDKVARDAMYERLKEALVQQEAP